MRIVVIGLILATTLSTVFADDPAYWRRKIDIAHRNVQMYENRINRAKNGNEVNALRPHLDKARAELKEAQRMYQASKEAANNQAKHARATQQWRSRVESQQQVMNQNNQSYRGCEDRCRYLRNQLSNARNKGQIQALREQLAQAEKDRDYWRQKAQEASRTYQELLAQQP